ncbi:MAG: PAS domain S-box protein [Gammaproteobacteria bacterium]|nr:PAS domain S-box protein [Gammaproteobacteria bacterium]
MSDDKDGPRDELAYLEAELKRLFEGNLRRDERLAALQELTQSCRRIEHARTAWTEAFDAIRDPVFLHDKDFRIVRVNRAYAARAGMPIGEIIGKPYWQVFPKGTGPLSCCLRAREKAEEEEEVNLANGEVLRSRTFSVRDERGKYRYSVHILEDVTERRRAAEALHESEERLRAMAAGAQDAILMIDSDGLVTFWNPAAERLFGYGRAEALGQPIHALIVPPPYRDKHIEGLARFKASGEGPVLGQVLELPALRKDGAEFPVELSISALQLKGRWHAVGILRDISARKQAEAALRDSEEKFKGIFNHALDGIVLADIETRRFQMANDTICRMLGYTQEEISRLSIADIHPAEDLAYVAQQFERQAKSEIALATDIPVKRKDGSVFFADINSSPLTLGGRRYLLGLFRDITERKQAEAALRKSNRALKTLSACNTTLIHATDEDRLLRDMCHVLIEQGGYCLAWIGFVEQGAAQSVRPMTHAGLDEGYVEALKVTWADSDRGRGPTGTAIRSGKTQLIQNIPADPAFAPWREEAIRRGYKSKISLPLCNDDEVFGVLSIYSAEVNAFTKEEIALLEELANDLAFGILTLRMHAERDRLQEQHLRGAERLKQALVGTIQAVATTVEKRDPYTAGHQQRVAQLCVAIASELGLDPERIEGLRLGALIHDIGKIYVPAEILNRPGRLTAAEFEIIKSHPQVGYDIVKDVKFSWPIAEMILQHHERQDGSGYPRGLKGEAIVHEARILAVADVIEAMSSHRPYRPARGVEPALEEIRRNRGRHYDPEVVDACLRLFERGKFQFDAASLA